MRIALLGDSYVEGFQVFDRDHFRSKLEGKLAPALDSVQVLNFGRSGFDVGDMYAYNKTFVREFQPDFSLYFIAGGDLQPKFRDPLRMKVRVEEDSLRVVKDYPPEYISSYRKTSFLIQYSVFFTMLNASRKIVNTQGLWPKLPDKFYPSASDLSDTLISMKENGIDPRFWKATNKSGHWNHAAHEAVAEVLDAEMLGIIRGGEEE